VQHGKPWERQPGESAPAYEARWIYFQLGPNRSQVSVGQKLGKSKALMERWSKRWAWVETARAYDDDRARQAARIVAERDEETIKAEIDQHAKNRKLTEQQMFSLGSASYSNAVKAMKAADDAKTLIDPEDWDLLTKAYERMVRQQRDSLEMTEARLNLRAPTPGGVAKATPMSGAAKAALKAFHSHEEPGDP